MLPWKLRKRHILPVHQNLSSIYFSLAKFQFVSCNLSLAMIWQIIYTHKLPKLCSATLKKNFTSVYFKMAWLHVIYYVILFTSSNLLQRNIAKVCHINKKLMPEKTFWLKTFFQSQLPLLLHLRVKIILNEWQLLDTLKLLSSWFESVT